MTFSELAIVDATLLWFGELAYAAFKIPTWHSAKWQSNEVRVAVTERAFEGSV